MIFVGRLPLMRYGPDKKKYWTVMNVWATSVQNVRRNCSLDMWFPSKSKIMILPFNLSQIIYELENTCTLRYHQQRMCVKRLSKIRSFHMCFQYKKKNNTLYRLQCSVKIRPWQCIHIALSSTMNLGAVF